MAPELGLDNNMCGASFPWDQEKAMPPGTYSCSRIFMSQIIIECPNLDISMCRSVALIEILFTTSQLRDCAAVEYRD